MAGRPERTSILLWPTLMTLVGLAILIGLGSWQLERLAWKEGLIDKIRLREQTEPMLLDAAAALHAAGQDLEYTRVRARGRLLNDRALFYFAHEKDGPGAHVYVPMQTPDGAIVIVNRGFLPDSQRSPFIAAARMPGPETEVLGLLRRPGIKGWFVPDNNIEKNQWYWRDLPGMAKAMTTGSGQKVVPFFLDAVAADAPAPAEPKAGAPSLRPIAEGASPVPRGGATRLELPNRHLEYALTWYGLAAALSVVYLTYLIRLRRQRRERWILGAARRRIWGNP